jgi:acetoin:2,6-dichlorophenolindophenol oxidoreductase subunit alpha
LQKEDEMNLSPDQLKEIWRLMIRARRFEEALRNEYKEHGVTRNRIPRGLHLALGQEAVSSGACAVLRPDDYLTTTHRNMGFQVARGVDMNGMMAEIFGRATGLCKGKGGSLGIADMSHGALFSNALVGADIPIASGVGLSIKMRKTDQICLCQIGDAASNTSRFHEGINFGSVFKLPVIYCVENNLYGISVPFSYHSNIKDISVRAQSYGIPGVTVDGNDPLAVYEAVSEAAARARKGLGPSLIECKTYLQGGAFEGDTPELYKPKAEFDAWMQKDPVPRFRKQLLYMEAATEKELDKIDKAAQTDVAKAIEFALASPYPDPKEVLTDMFV